MVNTQDPDSKVHVANMEPTWVLSAPGGPHVGPMNLAIRGSLQKDPRTTPSACYEKTLSYYTEGHFVFKKNMPDFFFDESLSS